MLPRNSTKTIRALTVVSTHGILPFVNLMPAARPRRLFDAPTASSSFFFLRLGISLHSEYQFSDFSLAVDWREPLRRATVACFAYNAHSNHCYINSHAEIVIDDRLVLRYSNYGSSPTKRFGRKGIGLYRFRGGYAPIFIC